MQGNDNRVDAVLRHSRAAKSEAAAVVDELREAAQEWHRRIDLKGRMERHPYRAMAAAVGIGYVLGGGLFTRLTAKLVQFGARAVLVPVLRAQLVAIGEDIAGGSRGPAPGYGGHEDGQGGL